MLADLDHELVTAQPVEALGAAFLAARIALAVAIGLGLILALRWLPAAARTMAALRSSAAGAPGAARPALAILLEPAGVPPEQVSWSEIRVGSGRRLAMFAVLIAVGAAVIGIASAIGLATARDLDTARFWRLVAGIDGALWVIATVTLGSVASNIAWRIAAAGRAIGVFAPLSDAPGRLLVGLVPPLLIFAGLVPIAAASPAPADLVCPSEKLTCAAIIVPSIHGGGHSQETISVVYGVHEAVGEPRGTLVVAVGGPGASGLGAADAMIDSFGDEVVNRYDIVFWDQRGIGRSDGHNCPVAGSIYAAVETTGISARDFVDACLREADMGGSDLGRYATTQAAEDLEAIRARIGADQFVLYGESYGTELAQVYAAAHPDRLTGLILDGAVDLTLSANDFWSSATHSFDDTLTATFDGCAVDSACRSDVRNAAAAYDRLLARLGASPITVSYADPLGQTGRHSIDLSAVEGAVATMMYEPLGRSLVLRAVAASERGDYVPMGRLIDLFGPGLNPIFSSFAYHAILCADYRVSPTDNQSDVDAVLAYGRDTGALRTRTDDVYLAQLPCLYWPVQPQTADRPAPLTSFGPPTIVLGAALDPITPIQFGRAIAARAANGYLVESSGGPHVIYGRENPCVDQVVERFLLEGGLPATRSVQCSDIVAESYIPLTALYVEDYEDAVDAMASIEDELFADPLYSFWDGLGTIQIGCRYSGFVTVTTGERLDTFRFNGCEYAAGMPLDGSGEFVLDQEVVTLDVTFPDGSLRYSSGAVTTVSGSFRGATVDVRR